MTNGNDLLIQEPRLLRFDVQPRTGRVRYTIAGYGHEIEGVADRGTSRLFVMLQFLADYAPSTLEALPAALRTAPAGDELATLMTEASARNWSHDVTGFGLGAVQATEGRLPAYEAIIHLPHRTSNAVFKTRAADPASAFRLAMEAAKASPDEADLGGG